MTRAGPWEGEYEQLGVAGAGGDGRAAERRAVSAQGDDDCNGQEDRYGERAAIPTASLALIGCGSWRQRDSQNDKSSWQDHSSASGRHRATDRGLPRGVQWHFLS